MHTFTNGNITVNVEENGRFSFVSEGIALENCLPAFSQRGQELPKIEWSVVSDAEHIVLKGANQVGVWELAIGTVCNKAGRKGISLRMKGTLNAPVSDLEYTLFSGATAELTHFQGQGQRMGGAKSLLLPLQKATAFVLWYTCVLM